MRASSACSSGRKTLTSPDDGLSVPRKATTSSGQKSESPAKAMPVSIISKVAAISSAVQVVNAAVKTAKGGMDIAAHACKSIAARLTKALPGMDIVIASLTIVDDFVNMIPIVERSGNETLALTRAKKDPKQVDLVTALTRVHAATNRLYFKSAWSLSKSVGEIAAGATKAGKALEQVDVAGFVTASVADDAREAIDANKMFLAYIFRNIHHADNIRLGGGKVDQEGLAAAVAKRDWETAKKFISDEVVFAHSVAGTPVDCRKQLEAYVEGGLNLPIVLPMGAQETRLRVVRMAREALG